MNARLLLAVAFAILLAGARPGLCQQPESNAETLTLDRAIEVALEQNRSARNARLEAAKSADSTQALKTRRLPDFKFNSLISQPLSTFDTKFEKGVFGTYPGIGPVPNVDTVIPSEAKPTALVLGQVSQPLSQLHRINLQIKQAKLGEEIAQAEVAAKQQAVVNEVKRTYYAILQTQGAMGAAQEATRLYRELDRVTGEYVMQQVALKTDQMNVQTKLARAEYDELTLNNLLASQKEQLNNLLGRDVSTRFRVTDGAEAIQVMMRETDLSEARTRALEQRPEVREARLQLERAKLDKRVKKSEFIPDVSLTANYVGAFNYSSFLPRNVSGLGVQVEWEVFDWGRRKREVSQRETAIKQAENSLAETQSRVLLEVNSQFRRVSESCQLIRIATLAQKEARANVQMASYRYRLEAVMLKDVLQAQASLANADYEYQKALLSFWTAKADFEKALGEQK